MKIPSSPAVTLRTIRLDRKLSLCRLAAMTGLPPQRLCDYERGARHVTESHLRQLCEALEVRFERVVRESAWTPGASGRQRRPFEALALDSFCPDAPFLPERTRDFAFRLRGAWKAYPAAMRRLESIIDRRKDLAALEAFLPDFPADSALEDLFDAILAALGAGPGMLSPARLGFHDLPVVDPRNQQYVGHRRRPSLVIPVLTGSVAFLPQVAVTVAGLKPILDYLVGVAIGGWASWSVVEMDGPLHDSEQDRRRDEAVGLPVLRLEERHLAAPTVGDELVEWLLRQHNLRQPSEVRRLAS